MQLVRTILVAAVLHGVFTVSIPLFIVKLVGGHTSPPFSGIVPALGFGLVLVGAVVYTWAAAELLLLTHATPLPLAHPPGLRTSGVYASVRNPLLLGVAIILAGEAIWFNSLLVLGYAALYWTWLHLFVVHMEEPDLEKRFGTEYLSYQARVPRWLPSVRVEDSRKSTGGLTSR